MAPTATCISCELLACYSLNVFLQAADTLDEAVDLLIPSNRSVTYVFVVTNTGNVALTDITITDPDLSIQDSSDVVHTIANLDPGEEATYWMEREFQPGYVENTASVKAMYQGDIVVQDSNSAFYNGLVPSPVPSGVRRSLVAPA
jgi:hypothetical protein